MSLSSTTKLSSKGQVVIPENIRNNMGLKAGMEFVVVGDRDVVVLKLITPPDIIRFSSSINRARIQARRISVRNARRPITRKKRR
jgi:AbrB family looped-hinge helix DNA binding protein